MNQHADWLFVMVNFCSLLGFVVSCILFFVNRSFPPRILALVLLCMSYSLFAYGLYVSGEFLFYPHLWRTPIFFSLCVAPLTYLYVRSILNQAYRPMKTDFYLFLPAILYTAQLIPFYILPASQKLQYIKGAINSKAYGAKEHEGILPPGIAVLFRMSYNLAITGYTYYLMAKWKKSASAQLLTHNGNKAIFNWLIFLTTVLLLNFASLVIGYWLQINQIMPQVRIPTITVTLSVLSISLYLLLKPEILYGLKGWVTEVPRGQDNIEKETSDDPNQNTRRISISIEQGNEFRALIEHQFQDKLSFCKPRYSIKDLSAETGVPSYLLSAFINQEYGKNFNEFVNDRRVDHLTAKVAQEPELLKYTLEVLGQMAGFNSRTAFTEAVKRRTGKMPSEIFMRSPE